MLGYKVREKQQQQESRHNGKEEQFKPRPPSQMNPFREEIVQQDDKRHVHNRVRDGKRGQETFGIIKQPAYLPVRRMDAF